MSDASKDMVKQLGLYADTITAFATAQLLAFIYLMAQGGCFTKNVLTPIWLPVGIGILVNAAYLRTSLGSYGPGQEKAPQAFRDAGFPGMLREEGLAVVDYGDLPVRRWRPDRTNLLAQHGEAVAACVRETEAHLSEPVSQGHISVVIGGNCTIELGVVAANLRKCENLGLIYLDLHADMNTPESTAEGALDWMGMAHILGFGASSRSSRRGSCPPGTLPSGSLRRRPRSRHPRRRT